VLAKQKANWEINIYHTVLGAKEISGCNQFVGWGCKKAITDAVNKTGMH